MRDVFNRPLTQGDFVALANTMNGQEALRIGIILSDYPVTKYNSKRLRIWAVKPTQSSSRRFSRNGAGYYAEPEKTLQIAPETVPEPIKKLLLSIYNDYIKRNAIEKEIKEQFKGIGSEEERIKAIREEVLTA